MYPLVITAQNQIILTCILNNLQQLCTLIIHTTREWLEQKHHYFAMQSQL